MQKTKKGSEISKVSIFYQCVKSTFKVPIKIIYLNDNYYYNYLCNIVGLFSVNVHYVSCWI